LCIKAFARPDDTPLVPVRAWGAAVSQEPVLNAGGGEVMKILKLLCGVLLALVFVSAESASETVIPAEATQAVNGGELDSATIAKLTGAESTETAALPAPVEDAVEADSMPDPADSIIDTASLDVPAAPDPGASTPESASEAPARARTLGKVGYDSEGRSGRIHVVERGDTLWDISDAYLGTPWVWPSIWTDNRNIEDPHLIHPADRIWITDSEMRVISRAEAEAMLNANPPAFPADQIDTVEVIPVDSPIEATLAPAEQVTRRVSVREWVGLVSSDEIDAAASIVKRVPAQLLLSQLDRAYIGLGEGEVEVGEQFDIVRKEERVIDPSTKRYLGHHVRTLGWLEVVEVHGESALARIGASMGDIWVGDKLLPRRPESIDITIQASPGDVSGEIVFFPQRRVVIGPLDFVYLNRGTLDGLESGSPLEVVRGGGIARESVRNTNVEIPNRVVATLLVVEAQAETSVALVAESETDLLVGDIFRGYTP
jgi:nucleoid-associated protein YgaU